MINPSKINDQRMWKKWRDSGAVGTIEDAVARQLANQGDLKIYEIGKNYAGPAAGYSTLSMGKRTVNNGPDRKVNERVLAVVVPGYDYALGQEFQKLPKGYKPLKAIFG